MQVVVLRILDDADHLIRWVRLARPDQDLKRPADRLLCLENLLGERVVDDRHHRSCHRVALVEIAPGHERDAQHLEKSRAHAIVERQRLPHHAPDDDAIVPGGTAGGHDVHRRCGLDARQPRQTCPQLAVERDLARRRHARVPHVEVGDEHALLPEAGIERREVA